MPSPRTTICPACGHVIEPRPKRKANMTDAELRAWIEGMVEHQPGPHPTPCWHWKGRRQHQGYGQTSYRGSTKLVHRLVYRLWYGEIPEGAVIMHLNDCHKACCNPAHLRLGTQKANVHEAMASGRFRADDPRLA